MCCHFPTKLRFSFDGYTWHSLNNILFSLSNLHELRIHLQTIRLGNKPMAYINPSLNNLTLSER